MRARLGLGVLERTEPGILLLDEIHEALDHEFRDDVERYAPALLERGGIVIATGHDHQMLERFCGRALLQTGHLIADGEFTEVQRTYLGGRHARYEPRRVRSRRIHRRRRRDLRPAGGARPMPCRRSRCRPPRLRR